ncbi:TorD/DmsD family molecular chaperone [Thermosulfuriphilus sp.]
MAQDLDLSIPSLNGLDKEQLRAEYTRLFISAPFGAEAPPYASVYLSPEGLLFQRPHDEALSFYRQAGLEVEGAGEPADHLAFELAFVGRLLEEESGPLLDDFLHKHLLRWYPAFLKRLLAAEPHPYFGFLARLTGEVLQKLSEEVSHEKEAFS